MSFFDEIANLQKLWWLWSPKIHKLLCKEDRAQTRTMFVLAHHKKLPGDLPKDVVEIILQYHFGAPYHVLLEMERIAHFDVTPAIPKERDVSETISQ